MVSFSHDNHSRYVCGVLRELQYQIAPETKAKLVRAIFDVAVDIRRSSPSFGQWVGAILSAGNKQQLWEPESFVHGFLILSDVAEVQYKARGFWNKGCKRAIRWDDPELAIHWPLDLLEGVAVNLSEKDAAAPSFKAVMSGGDVFL